MRRAGLCIVEFEPQIRKQKSLKGLGLWGIWHTVEPNIIYKENSVAHSPFSSNEIDTLLASIHWS